MITISVIGLDQYVVGHYSKQHSKNLAALFETSEDNISFIAPDCYIFHNGVEQTSWNSIVRVTAPRQFEKLEANVAKYLLKTLKQFSINIRVEFFYFDKNHCYEFVNNEYPHFIKEENVVNVEEGELEEGEEIYDGNIFEEFAPELSKKEEGGHCHCHDDCDCDCGDDCDCDDDCDCECSCHHKH